MYSLSAIIASGFHTRLMKRALLCFLVLLLEEDPLEGAEGEGALGDFPLDGAEGEDGVEGADGGEGDGSEAQPPAPQSNHKPGSSSELETVPLPLPGIMIQSFRRN